MKFKIGDKVRIKKDLQPHQDYGEETLVPEMMALVGKVVTIKQVYSAGYTVEEDLADWNWTDEMFEGKDEQPQTIIKDFIYHGGRMTFTETDVKTQTQSNDSFIITPKKERVIHNGNATIVILDDGTKGVAKCNPEDKYDRVKGIKIAFNRAKIKLLQKELKSLTK